MIDRTATARIQRLVRWLEPFQRCFGHRAQRLALRTYVHGLFSDSDRKSMQAMLVRVTQPVTYQAFLHLITHAMWDAERIVEVAIHVTSRQPFQRRGATEAFRAHNDATLGSRFPKPCGSDLLRTSPMR